MNNKRQGNCRQLLAVITLCCCFLFTACGDEKIYDEERIILELEAAGVFQCERTDLGKQIEMGDVPLEVQQMVSDIVLYRFFYESDELDIEGYIAIPLVFLKQKAPYPCVIYNHGGHADLGELNGLETAVKAYLLDMICIASNFRGCGVSEGKDNFGGDDVNDVIRLIDIIEKCGFIDSGQINMLGVSRGGMMTYETLRRDERIHRAVVAGALSDAFAAYEERQDMREDVFEEYVGGTPGQMPDEYEKRSAVRWADEINTPVMIVHALNDPRAAYVTQALHMVKNLEKHGKEYELITYDDDSHAAIHEEDYPNIREWLLTK